MLRQILQQKGINYRKHTLYSDRIVVEYRTIAKTHRYEISLEDLGYHKEYISVNPWGHKIFLGICVLLPITYVISGIQDHNLHWLPTVLFTLMCGALATFFNFKKQIDDLYLTGGKQHLVFYRNIPDEEQVEAFANEVIKASRSCIRNKYARYDAFTPESDFSQRINYLRNNDIISDKEYYKLLSDFKTSRLLQVSYN